MSKIESILSDFGLEEKEIAVYRVCLKEDDMSPFKIAKLTGIPRTTVYDVLMNLSLKGLVQLEQSDGFTKQQTRVRAENPSVLRKILQEKRKALTGLEMDIITILPHLKEDFQKEEANADFQFFPGVEGFRKIYRDQSLEELDVQRYSWDCLMPMDALGPDTLNELVNKQLSSEKKRTYPPKEIVSLNDWTRHVLSYQYGRDKNYLANREIRYIENPAFDISVELNIYGAYIVISCANKKEVWGMRIKSEALSKTLEAIFLMQWMTAKPVTGKMIDSWGPSEMLAYEKKKTK